MTERSQRPYSDIWRHRKAIILVAALTLSSGVLANDSAVKGVGGSISPRQGHPSVRLVRERVEATIIGYTVKVRCEFHLKNEGAATTVRMGFPERGGGDIRTTTTTHLASFKSSVDGRRVATSYVVSNKEYSYSAWHIKSVQFAAGQPRTVVDEYTAELGRDSMGGLWFDYILETGRSWKGPVGRAEFVVDIRRIPKEYLLEKAAPEGYLLRDGRVKWCLTNFEPDQDVKLQFDLKEQFKPRL